MEFVLGILLLFGVFTLGTVTPDDMKDETHTVQSESARGEHPAGRSFDADQLHPCPVRGSMRPYRDLTVSIPQPDPQPATDEADDAVEFGWDD